MCLNYDEINWPKMTDGVSMEIAAVMPEQAGGCDGVGSRWQLLYY